MYSYSWFLFGVSSDGFLSMSSPSFLLISHASCSSLFMPCTYFGHFLPITSCVILLVASLNLIYISSMLTSLPFIRSNGSKAPPFLILDVIKYCDHPRWYKKYLQEVGPLIGGEIPNWRCHLQLEVEVGPPIGGEIPNWR